MEQAVGNLISVDKWKEKLGADKHSFGFTPGIFEFRTKYIHKYGFYILTKESFDNIVEICEGKKCIEVGCGTGFLSANLVNAGISCDAVDNKSRKYGFEEDYVEVIEYDCTKIDFLDYDVVIMCWPCYKSDHAYQILKNMHPGQILIYQGEGHGGCCADDQFFDHLSENFDEDEDSSDAINKNHVQFPGIHDFWTVTRKK